MRKLIVLFAFASMLGCSATPCTVPGDSYSTAVANDGAPTWARTVDAEKWCEWFYPSWRSSLSPWLVVAFDLVDWEAWTTPVRIEGGTTITIDSKDASVEVDGKVYQRPREPRAKWVRYDIGAAWRNR